MKLNRMAGKGWAKRVLLALFAVIVALFYPFVGGMSALNGEAEVSEAAVSSGVDSHGVTPAAYSSEPCTVHYFKVEATVNEDRTIDFTEEISFTMNVTPSSGIFYRSLPTEGDRFLNITAVGVHNPDFSYRIIDNPEVDGFIDIECHGGVYEGETLTYRFTYTMETYFSGIEENGMIIDFIGGGWPFTLNNVDVKINFPNWLETYAVYSSSFGTASNDYVEVIDERFDVLHLHADTLPLTHSEFGYYAAPVTVEFMLTEGTLIPESEQAFASPTLLPTALIAIIMAVVSIVLAVLFNGKKPILSTVVGFTAPDGMDPMELGYVLDGVIDTDDVTSMIYYFASKGYLHISMRDNEVVLTRKRMCSLPDEESAHAKALFEGLFDDGREQTEISDLQNSFYMHIDKAKLLIGAKRPKMYQPKSVGRFALFSLLALAGLLLPVFAVGAFYIGGGYFPLSAFMMGGPVAAAAILTWISENYRYKWSRGKHTALLVVWIVIYAIFALIWYMMLSHVLTGFERLLALACGFVPLILQRGALARNEEYVDRLGKILGFKEFILVTKKDRIEAMLETNPELFYDVLPYAQVMNVSDEWEEKFKTITIKPPRWYDGDFNYFDYWLISRSMRSINLAMVSRPSNTSVGGGGGGGFSGGFSGGGGGGGGGGFR